MHFFNCDLRTQSEVVSSYFKRCTFSTVICVPTSYIFYFFCQTDKGLFWKNRTREEISFGIAGAQQGCILSNFDVQIHCNSSMKYHRNSTRCIDDDDYSFRREPSPCTKPPFDVDAEIAKILATCSFSKSAQSTEIVNAIEYYELGNIVLPPPIRFRRRGNQSAKIIKNESN